MQPNVRRRLEELEARLGSPTHESRFSLSPEEVAFLNDLAQRKASATTPEELAEVQQEIEQAVRAAGRKMGEGYKL